MIIRAKPRKPRKTQMREDAIEAMPEAQRAHFSKPQDNSILTNAKGEWKLELEEIEAKRKAGIPDEF